MARRLLIFEDNERYIDKVIKAVQGTDHMVEAFATNPEDSIAILGLVRTGHLKADTAFIDGNLRKSPPPGYEKGQDARDLVSNIQNLGLVSSLTIVDFSSDGFRELGIGGSFPYIGKDATPEYILQFIEGLPAPAKPIFYP